MTALSLVVAALHRRPPELRSPVDLARVAEEAGVDQIVFTDHVVIGENTDRYPYGPWRFEPDDPWPEPLTVLAAVAGATSRIRLSTGVLIAPLRPAVLLAKTVATLDELSGGRVDLGVGVGWQREEYEAVGVPFSERWSRLDDTMRACRVLWSQAPASFSSPSVSFEGVWCSPRPAQERLPVWVGAKITGATARRIAEWGDGWYPIAGMRAADIEPSVQRLRSAFEDAGRDPSTLGVRATLRVGLTEGGGVDLSGLEPVPELLEAGATMFGVLLPRVETIEHARNWLAELVALVRDRG